MAPTVKFTAKVPADPELLRELRAFKESLKRMEYQLSLLRTEEANTKEDVLQKFDDLKDSVDKLGSEAQEAVSELGNRPTEAQVTALQEEVAQEVAQLGDALHPPATPPPADVPPTSDAPTPDVPTDAPAADASQGGGEAAA